MALKSRLLPAIPVTQWQKLIFLFALALVADISGLAGPLVQSSHRALTPARHWWVQGANRIYSFWNGLQKLPRSVERIQDLERRLAQATVSLGELETLRRENEELRLMLEGTDRPLGRPTITGPIIAFARPALAIGSEEGVREGAVVLSRNTLLGVISAVSAHESQVVLLSESAAPSILARTTSGTTGVVVGDGRRVVFTEVSKEAALAVGDQIITVGQPQIGQNLLIGTVVRVINEPSSSVQSAVIQQAVSFFETPLVEVR